MKGSHAVGTIRATRISYFSILSNKDLEKAGWGALDFRSDLNSGWIIAKLVENKIVHICSNYVGVKPMSTIQHWDKTRKLRAPI